MVTEYKSDRIWNLLKTDNDKSRVYTKIKEQEDKKSIKKVPRDKAKTTQEKLESEGWKEYKRTTKTIQMRRPKPYEDGESFEHEVWCLMYELGFGDYGNELNALRDFEIPNGPISPPKQIDVFAKDELATIIIECKDRQTPGKNNKLKEILAEIKSFKQYMNPEIEDHYKDSSNPPYFMGYILATRNTEWNKEDRARAKSLGVAILTEREIEYFRELSRLIGSAARYQFLGELFSGEYIEKMGDLKIPALRLKYKKTYCYQFTTDATTLARIGFIQHRAAVRNDDENELGYQRMANKYRLGQIAQYINKDNVFPTNIVINIRDTKNMTFKPGQLEYQPSTPEEHDQKNIKFGMLTLPATFKSAWIIDGQHRLFSYFHKDTHENFKTRPHLPVLAFENLSAEEETNLFVNINNKQVKVRSSLLLVIKSDLDIDSDDPNAHLHALISKLVLRLDSDINSPIRGLINSENTISKKAFLAFPEIFGSLKGGSLLGSTNKKQRLPGPLTSSEDDWRKTIDRSFPIICAYLNIFKEKCAENWNFADKTNKQGNPGGHLCTTRGIANLLYLLDFLINHIKHEEYLTEFDLWSWNKDVFLSKIEKYLQPIIEYFQNPSYEDIEFVRGFDGSGAAKKGARQLEVIINNSNINYNPPNLEEEKEKLEDDLREQLQKIWTPIEKDLQSILIKFLKHKYPVDKNPIGWALNGFSDSKYQQISSTAKQSNSILEDCINIPTHVLDSMDIKKHKQEMHVLFEQENSSWIQKSVLIRNFIRHEKREGKATVGWKQVLRDMKKPINQAKKNLRKAPYNLKL